MKKLTEYSESLGLSKSYLGVYRTNRGFPKKTPAVVVYDAYKAELLLQENTRVELQELCYELNEKRGDTTYFARHLVGKGIIVSEKSLRGILEHSFKNLDSRLIGQRHTKRHLEILKHYKEWRCLTSS